MPSLPEQTTQSEDTVMPTLRFVTELLTFAALLGTVYLWSVIGPTLRSVLVVAQL